MVELKDIEKLAELSRISLTDTEKVQMRSEIDSILGYVTQIQKVSGQPRSVEDRSSHKDEVRNVLREDDGPDARLIISGSCTEALLGNVPKRNGDYVEVKKILG